MAVTIDIGSNLETAAPSRISLGVQGAGASVTVLNVAGATLDHFIDLHSSAAFSKTAGQSQTHSAGPVWLVPRGRVTVKLTGGIYGS
jgi:hypothetical protein